jgi:type VI protein secretion system component VasK
MKKWLTIITIGTFTMICLPTATYAQEEPKNEHFEKKKEERKQAAEEAEKEITKHHEKIQSKETRKMMKRTKRKSNRIKAGKPADTWFQRTFRK